MEISSTNSMIWPTLHWFHVMLGHPGSCCLCATLQAWYHHLQLHMHIEPFACDECQHAKSSGPNHGLLPDQDFVVSPWKEVAVNLIDP